MKMQKLLILCLVMVLSMVASTALAEEVRWAPIEGEEGMYVDTETATYDAKTNSIYFWTKYEEAAELINMDYWHVDLNTAQDCVVQGLFYQNLVYPKVNIYPDKPNVDVWPDDVIEKAANMVCDRQGAPRMYPAPDNRWKWLYTAPKRTTEYAPEMIRVNEADHTVVVWTQDILPDGSRTGSTKWICYIYEKAIEYINAKGVLKQEVQPDTLEDRIFTVARRYFEKAAANTSQAA